MNTYNGSTAQELANEVKKMISGIRLISDREQILSEYEMFYFDDFYMGSGGVGQYKEMKDGTLRIQIGYGKGRNNKARCAVIKAN